MKRHALGLLLCALYVAATVVCLVLANQAGGDLKGQFVLMQAPLTPVLALMYSAGMIGLVRDLGWVSAYAVLYPMELGFLYGAGWLLTRALIFIGSLLTRRRTLQDLN
jgi:hypothetical protein